VRLPLAEPAVTESRGAARVPRVWSRVLEQELRIAPGLRPSRGDIRVRRVQNASNSTGRSGSNRSMSTATTRIASRRRQSRRRLRSSIGLSC